MLQFELFSDYFAHRQNRFTGESALVTVLFSVTALVLVLTSDGVGFHCLIFALFSGFCLAMRIPLRIYGLRLALPLASALFFYLYGTFAGFAGLPDLAVRPLVIVSRLLAAFSVFLFVGFSVPLEKLAATLRTLGVPATLVELLLCSYRYIFVLIDRALVVRDAQMIRGGYAGMRRGVASLGVLSAMILERGIDQAVRTSEAMRMRGYDGTIRVAGARERVRHPGFWCALTATMAAAWLALGR